MKPAKKIQCLFNRYLSSQCSGQDVHRVLQYFNTGKNKTALKSLIRKELNASESSFNKSGVEAGTDLEIIFNKIKEKIKL